MLGCALSWILWVHDGHCGHTHNTVWHILSATLLSRGFQDARSSVLNESHSSILSPAWSYSTSSDQERVLNLWIHRLTTWLRLMRYTLEVGIQIYGHDQSPPQMRGKCKFCLIFCLCFLFVHVYILVERSEFTCHASGFKCKCDLLPSCYQAEWQHYVGVTEHSQV